MIYLLMARLSEPNESCEGDQIAFGPPRPCAYYMTRERAVEALLRIEETIAYAWQERRCMPISLRWLDTEDRSIEALRRITPNFGGSVVAVTPG